MSYKITIEVSKEENPSGYTSWDEIYLQVVENIDIPSIVGAVLEAEFPDDEQEADYCPIHGINTLH